MSAALLVRRRLGSDTELTFSVIYSGMPREKMTDLVQTIPLDEIHARLPISELQALFVAGLLKS